MRFRSAVIFSVVLLTVSPSLGCEINGLTDAIDRLKGGKEPTAGRIAFACSNAIQGREIEKNLAEIVLTLHSVFDSDPKLKDAVANCSPEALTRAC